MTLLSAAKQIENLWFPEIITLKDKYLENQRQLFPGLVAFLGMQLSLWPIWLQGITKSSMSYNKEETDYQLQNPSIHLLPWYCLFQSVSDTAGWVLVRGENLPETISLFNELQDPQVNKILSMLDSHGRTMVYGQAKELFNACGALNDNRLHQVEESVSGLGNRVIRNEYGYLYRLTLPTLQVEQIISDWSFWKQAVMPLIPTIFELASDHAQFSTFAEAKNEFHKLMQILWKELSFRRIINCGPFIPSQSMPSLNLFWRRDRKQESFSGLMLVLGDHQQLWRIVLDSWQEL